MDAICPTGCVWVSDFGRILANEGVRTGPKKIFQQLQGVKLMAGTRATSYASTIGWLHDAVGEYERHAGVFTEYKRCYITPIGQTAIRSILTLNTSPEKDMEHCIICDAEYPTQECRCCGMPICEKCYNAGHEFCDNCA